MEDLVVPINYTTDMDKRERNHDHYFIDVSDYDEIDFYVIAGKFGITDPCIQHVMKKCLAVGRRGYKDDDTDIQDMIDTLERYKAIKAKEKEKSHE